MANTHDTPGSSLRLIHQPFISLYVLLDQELISAIQEALTTQVLLNNTPQDSPVHKDASRHLRHLREDVGTRIVWQFTEALRGGR